MKPEEKLLKLVADRATFCIGYLTAIDKLIQLVERMQHGEVLCNVHNLTEFVRVHTANAYDLARMEIPE